MALKITINPHLEILPTIDYREANELQGKLKDLSKENFSRLLKAIQHHGLLMPFAMWVDPESKKMWLIDGHQRRRLFMMEKVEPFLIPYILIPGNTLDEAKMNLLQITSQYGKVTEAGFQEFTLNMPKEWVQDTIYLDALAKQFEPKIEIKKFDKELVLPEKYQVIVEFNTEKEQRDFLEQFKDKYQCKAFTF